MPDEAYTTLHHVHLDSKRRPTLPARLLEEADLVGTINLVARADGPGRIVLENPDTLLKGLQDKLTETLREAGESPATAVDTFLAERTANPRAER